MLVGDARFAREHIDRVGTRQESVCMAIPTKAQLFEEVDRRFAADHPDAPQRLDPDDPNQQQWVQDWVQIREQILNEWTDYVFFEFFPDGHTLDPSNPDDAVLIEYWKDIQHQINTGEAGRWPWNSDPAPAPLSDAGGCGSPDQRSGNPHR